MAHFRGTVQGNRGEVSRCGTRKAGLSASLNGWHLGCDVELSFDEKEQKDVVSIYITRGSSGRGRTLVYQTSNPPET